MANNNTTGDFINCWYCDAIVPISFTAGRLPNLNTLARHLNTCHLSPVATS